MQSKLIDCPNERQREFFLSRTRFTAYGGARGGGKSWAVRHKAMLMGLAYPGIRMLIIDIAACYSDPEVIAAHGGTVLLSGYDSGGGNYVVLRGEFSDRYDVITRYFHLAKRSVVKGRYLQTGERIGIQGNTGTQTTGQHLHFEVWIVPKNVGYSVSLREK